MTWQFLDTDLGAYTLGLLKIYRIAGYFRMVESFVL